MTKLKSDNENEKGANLLLTPSLSKVNLLFLFLRQFNAKKLTKCQNAAS